ncbi:putative blue copper protein [Flavihumibacter petaseus NBRC 106054]|uniref:Putative blue copper protein n=2 Tax=Flavihumibacter TaxID=1004301 RepID=A0A0E9N5T8_9BACT|nr:putative blue copper protein [Flavihumibacter petaseus NBRC 106054]
MVFVSLAGCSKGDSYGSSGSNNNNGNNNTSTVLMENNNYSKASLTIKKGSTVTWKNNDYTTHNVTADDNSFNSGDIIAGYSYSRKFDASGTFPYHCTHHATMKATVVVN